MRCWRLYGELRRCQGPFPGAKGDPCLWPWRACGGAGIAQQLPLHETQNAGHLCALSCCLTPSLGSPCSSYSSLGSHMVLTQRCWMWQHTAGMRGLAVVPVWNCVHLPGEQPGGKRHSGLGAAGICVPGAAGGFTASTVHRLRSQGVLWECVCFAWAIAFSTVTNKSTLAFPGRSPSQFAGRAEITVGYHHVVWIFPFSILTRMAALGFP